MAPSAPTTVTSAGISVIGSLRRAAAMASPSRVWAFSRPSKSSQAASQLSRSTIDGAAWVVNGWNGNRVTVRSYRENGGSSRGRPSSRHILIGAAGLARTAKGPGLIPKAAQGERMRRARGRSTDSIRSQRGGAAMAVVAYGNADAGLCCGVGLVDIPALVAVSRQYVDRFDPPLVRVGTWLLRRVSAADGRRSPVSIHT